MQCWAYSELLSVDESFVSDCSDENVLSSEIHLHVL